MFISELLKQTGFEEHSCVMLGQGFLFYSLSLIFSREWSFFIYSCWFLHKHLYTHCSPTAEFLCPVISFIILIIWSVTQKFVYELEFCTLLDTLNSLLSPSPGLFVNKFILSLMKGLCQTVCIEWFEGWSLSGQTNFTKAVTN